MTEKRFMVDDAGTLIDMETRNTYDYVSDVCDLLNDLNNENKTIKHKLQQQEMEYATTSHRLAEENQQLRELLENGLEVSQVEIDEELRRKK